jgi:hypothetical protein
VTCGAAAIAFSGVDGSIRTLTDSTTGRQWVGNCSSGGSLATFGYQTYSAADFSQTCAREYTTTQDFQKPGMAAVRAAFSTSFPGVGSFAVNSCQIAFLPPQHVRSVRVGVECVCWVEYAHSHSPSHGVVTEQ